jgi:Mg-chelatase subunit ChlD
MKVFTDRVLFLVDASGSMNAGRPRRIETARKELAQALSRLTEKTRFNVVGFGGSPMWWSPTERDATPKAVADAKDFVAGLSVGGATNLYDTLVAALERNRQVDTIYLLGDGCPSAGKVQEHDEILARIRWLNRLRKVRIHTVALVRRPVPAPRGVPITPSKREEDEQEAAHLLSRLAAENGGTFLRLDG